MKSSFEQNGGTYRQVGEFKIPNLTLSPEEATIKLGKWGTLHKEYLEKHNRVFFNVLLTQGKLYQHCADVENQAQQMFDTLVVQMKELEGVTEQLKKKNQMEWINKMNNIHNRATEIINAELIYRLV